MNRLLLLLALLAAWAAPAQSLVPRPATLVRHEGCFRLESHTPLVCDPRLERAAEYLAGRLVPGPRTTLDVSGPAVRLRLDPRLGSETYRLEVDRMRGVCIDGGDYGGVICAIQTLLQLLPPETLGDGRLPAEVPCLEIYDTPRYAYRGLMLDVARTWLDTARLKRYIDLMALHKLNRLHLHLADDEGWRIEIKSHPELALVGGFRGGDSPVAAIYGRWGERYGGFYTQEELRGVIDYAAARNVEIIPEIDLPGHSRCIAQVRPEILCPYTPDRSVTAGYEYRNVWCAAREENYALLEDILGEVCALFPSPYVHVGGDEVEPGQWQRCPHCSRLGDAQAVQDRFMLRVGEILARHGKRAAVWDESARSGRLPHTSRVHGWQSVQSCREAAARGYETVVMPGQYFYFDMRQSPREAGHDWAAIFDVRKTYGFDPATCGFTPDEARHVAGVEGSFFSELYLSHDPSRCDYLDYMLFPRLCALAEMAWYGGQRRWEEFEPRLRRHGDRLSALGVTYRLDPPRVNYRDGRLTASAAPGETLWYTTERDTVPQRYTAPIATAAPEEYLFVSRRGTGRSPETAVEAHYRTLRPAVRITSSMQESARFPFSNAELYRGISRTQRTCRPGDWIRYDFAEPLVCRSLSLRTGNLQLPRFIFDAGYVEVSYDGVRFERAGDLSAGQFTLERPARPIRAARIVATCNGNGSPFVTVQSPVVRP